MPKSLEVTISPSPWGSKVEMDGELVRGVQSATITATYAELTTVSLGLLDIDHQPQVIAGVFLPEEEYEAWFRVSEEAMWDAYHHFAAERIDAILYPTKEGDWPGFKAAIQRLKIVPERLEVQQQRPQATAVPDQAIRDELTSALLRGIGGLDRAQAIIQQAGSAAVYAPNVKYMGGMLDLRGVAALLATLGDPVGLEYFARERKRHAYDPLQNGGHCPVSAAADPGAVLNEICEGCGKPWPCPTVLDIEAGRK